MRIQAKDLRGERKLKLWDVVPLSSPWTLFVDVTNYCNFKCVFCPTGNPEMVKGLRGRGHMNVTLFEKILKDMKRCDKLKMLNLYKDGEPLAHPLFTDMVRLAKNARVTEKIWTKTNGELIPRFPGLGTCGLDMIGISVPHVTDDGIFKTVGRHVNYDQYRENIKRLFEGKRTCEISVKIADVGLTDSEINKFYDDFEHISDYIAIEGLHGWSASDVKNMQIHDSGTFDGNPFDEKVCCPLPFYMMTINYDGTVSVCNDDWGYWHKLGDVREQSVKAIWNGKAYRDFRLMHLEGRRSENEACGTCQYVNALPDNIDEHREVMKNAIMSGL